MKHFILMGLAISLSASGFSQHFLDISGGINVSKIGNYASDKFRIGSAAGLGYEFRFAKILSVRTGLTYNQRGGMYETVLWDSGTNESFDRYYPVKTEYFSLSALFGLVGTGDTYGFGRLGAMLSYFVDAEASRPDYQSAIFETESFSLRQDFNSLDIVGLIEGGVGTSVGSRVIIEGTVAFQMGLSNAVSQYDPYYGYPASSSSNEITIELPDNPHFGFSVMVAVKYRLGKLKAK